MGSDKGLGEWEGNPYQDGRWSSEELRRERECVQWLMAEADLESPDPEARERRLGYLRVAVGKIEEELRRRERLARSRYAPRVRRGPTVDQSGTIARIKAELPVQELLRRYGVPMRQAGERLVCRCPLPGHADRTPSFTVYPDGGWYCFGCQRGGDVFAFARWMLGERSFVRVVERLGEEAARG